MLFRAAPVSSVGFGWAYLASAGTLRWPQRLDLASERAVLGRHIALYIGKAAVDILHARADIAGGSRRRGAHTLPELLRLAILSIQALGLGWRNPASDEVDRQD